jgi:hypothetical protein
MKRALAVATVLLGMGLAGTGYAAPKPIKVWLYGDGQSTRMYSELTHLLPGTNITVVSGAVNSTGPEGLANTVYLHFLANPNSRPDVVHIGYAASNSSYWNCATNPNWQQNYAAIALQEATAIRDAATVVNNFGKKVLLTKGTGHPEFFAISPCMNAATAAVTWNLAILAPQYAWVDYSGYTAGVAAPVEESLKFNPFLFALWQSDAVHVSCDKDHFMPGTAYSLANCVTVTTQAQRALLGAWRVAKTVLKAYKHFQQ